MNERVEDEGKEKHVPVIEDWEKGVKVRVGSVPHPMEENHHIEWIELNTDGDISRKGLDPGDPPEAEFRTAPGNATARIYCNVHGLWKSR